MTLGMCTFFFLYYVHVCCPYFVFVELCLFLNVKRRHYTVRTYVYIPVSSIHYSLIVHMLTVNNKMYLQCYSYLNRVVCFSDHYEYLHKELYTKVNNIQLLTLHTF